MHSDLLRIRQLAAAAAWQTPLGHEIHDLAEKLLTELDARPEAVIIELGPHRDGRRLRAA